MQNARHKWSASCIIFTAFTLENSSWLWLVDARANESTFWFSILSFCRVLVLLWMERIANCNLIELVDLIWRYSLWVLDTALNESLKLVNMSSIVKLAELESIGMQIVNCCKCCSFYDVFDSFRYKGLRVLPEAHQSYSQAGPGHPLRGKSGLRYMRSETVDV
jgi:hypothetical protein